MGTNAKLTIKQRLENFKAMEKEDKRRWWGEFFIDNSLYIFLIAAIIGIAVYNPNFVSMKSIINIVSLSAANLPIALGIAGAIILTGTDLSAGRVVGLTACVAASLLQMAEYPNKMFPGIGTVPVPIVILAVIASARWWALSTAFVRPSSICTRSLSRWPPSSSCTARCSFT